MRHEVFGDETLPASPIHVVPLEVEIPRFSSWSVACSVFPGEIRAHMDKQSDLFSRLLTKGEIEYCQRFKKRPEERIAGLFAAKHTISQLLGVTFEQWQQIDIAHTSDGAPRVGLGAEMTPASISVSISHESTAAVALALKQPDEPGSQEIIGIGVDVCSPSDDKKSIERGTTRGFTDQEHAYCRNQEDPHNAYAKVQAAKEAVIKAVETISYWNIPEIEIIFDENGQIHIRLIKNAAEKAQKRGITDFHVAIGNHENIGAFAFCIAV